MFKNSLGKILDLSIYFSFDKSGFDRHIRDFGELNRSLGGKKAIVTGGTSGIGHQVALHLEKNGSTVICCSRKSRDFISSERSRFHSLDMGDFSKVIEFSTSVDGTFDYLILNAGGMPEKLMLNDKEIESQFASQVVGHYILFRSLLEQGKLNEGCKVVWTASGGMYPVKFQSDFIHGNKLPYDKVATYANAKRAQVILNRLLFEKYGVFQAVMHPGWVDTPGVRDSIPGFFEFTKNRLRSPAEGADTINWIISTEKNLTPGELWFDRKIRKKIFFPWTKNTKQEQKMILDLCEKIYEDLTNNL